MNTFKPPQPINVSCPMCGAYPGRPCTHMNDGTVLSGKPLKRCHAERIEAAGPARETQKKGRRIRKGKQV